MFFLWVFLPITLTVYYLLGFTHSLRLQNLWLLFVSILFYSFGEPKYIILLLFSVFINYVSGLLLAGFSGQRENRRGRRLVLFICVAINLLLLGYFKYYDFTAELIIRILHREILPVRSIALPIGISFYTFQAMSYCIDLYRGKTRVQRSFWELALYITLFPQLIAGPIVRYRDVADQIRSRSCDLDRFTYGISRFSVGLAKKVLIANTAAKAVDTIFAMEPSTLHAGYAWAGAILYTLQIYYDFSGYSDMAIGLGKMFGFDFLENFDLPYVSASVREFWRRWHISLSTWFREYLYIPLGGSRRGSIRTYVNLFIVFLATGLWHGANMTFIVWGLWNGMFLIIERIFLGKWLDENRFRFINHIYTMLVVVLGWVIFRADSLGQALSYYRAMLNPHGAADFTLTELLGRRCIAMGIIGILLCGIIPRSFTRHVRDNALLRIIYVPVLLILCMLLLSGNAYNPFIYFRF